MIQQGIKNVEEKYQELLKEGYSPEMSVQIINRTDLAPKGNKSKPYDLWTKEELYQEAMKVGIPGRSYMNKRNLVKSLLSSIQNN